MALGFCDKRRTQATSAAGTSVIGTPANYVNKTALRTRLAAANGTYFTTARLNQMNENDMTYALRQIDDAAGIK